jgi:hypothetical protein
MDIKANALTRSIYNHTPSLNNPIESIDIHEFIVDD